ncbi:hypothetical protein H5399_01200 [Tessaracoccus sp. MC1627]|uniref:sensor histidine kinase n=1 Tax=Tessaracoccus sp. MC1627 TaxID=2760312 RepID=UPI001603F0F6|nr:histidine kinase [Tessaracoccus sp. MC1627]MBB1511228.1 hypothetical protein [Tessaracoccus sp. MC1627]
MRSWGASHVVLVVVAFGLATAAAWREGWPLTDLVFVGVLLSFLVLLFQGVWRSAQRARLARRRQREVVAVAPDDAARRAVEDERARLSAEIDRSVRRSLIAVRGLVAEATAAADPRVALTEMQRESRQAMAELRRQLGLLGAESPPTRLPESPSHPDAGAVDSAGSRGHTPITALSTPHASGDALSRGDAVLTAAVVALAAVEVLFTPGQSGSVLTSVAMALTVLARRIAPVPSALACATILLLGAVVDAPVGDGVFYAIVVGMLLWRLLEPVPTAASLASAGVLYVSAVGTRYLHEPDNAPINIVLLGVVATAALIVGRARRSRATAEERSLAHEAELAEARGAAAATTRREVARELHDVVSHAVSLVAVQAGAAELAWPHDGKATRDGLRAIADTVSTALAELDARPGEGTGPGWQDVVRTVDRLRAAGLRVELHLAVSPPDQVMPTVHRIVQESLTNVLKHAPAATARVVVSNDGQRTRVEVTDDGPGRTGAVGGYGLAGLQDRVGLIGGTLSVGEADGGGFAVRAVLPNLVAEVRAP